MKKLFLILSIFIFSFVYANDISITAGYEPVFLHLKTDNKLINGSLKSNGITAKATYLFNDKIGVNLSLTSTLFPKTLTREYVIENNNTKLNKETEYNISTNNFTAFQIGFSLIGDCDFCYFKTQLAINTSFLKAFEQFSVYSGLTFDYSYNQKISNMLLSAGCNIGIDFISFSNMLIENEKITKTYKLSPYITFGITF